MADLSLRYMLYGEDRTASKSIKGVGTQATSTASMVSGSMSKMGNMVGGEVGDMLNRVSSGLDGMGEKTKGLAPKMIMAGTAVTGLGLAMQAMASGDIASMQQLDAAVKATGKGYAGFGEDVKKLIEAQVAFGHTDDEVTTSLRVLTQAYNDPKKALGEMGLVTDLAAAKHISLATAAGLVAKAHGGAGKVFKEFGIVVGTNANGTKNYDGALTQLSTKLKGQASASMDTFSGKVKIAQTWLTNQASAISEKLGPALTIAGPLIAAAGSVMQVMATRSAAAATAMAAEATATEGATIATRVLATAQRLLTAAMGPVGIALTVLTVIAAGFIKSQMDSKQRIEDITETLDKQTGAITDNTNAVVVKSMIDNGAYEAAKKMSIGLNDVTEAALGNTAAAARVAAGMDAYGKASTAAGTSSAETGNNINTLGNALGTTTGDVSAAVKAAQTYAEVTSAANGPVKTLAQEQKEMAAKTKLATEAVKTYLQGLVDAGLAVLSTRSAQRALTQSVADASAKLKENGRTLDINTQKGRDNQAALDTQAGAAIDLAKSVGVGNDAQNKMRVSLTASRTALVQTAMRFGMTRADAEKYATSVLKIPPHKKTDVELRGDKVAKDKATALKLKIDNLPGSKNIDITVGVTFNAKSGLLTSSLGVGGMASAGRLATGGEITGSGGPTQDNIPLWGSVGEFMVNAKSYAKHGALVNAINADKLAGGGPVSLMPPPLVTRMDQASHRFIAGTTFSLPAGGGGGGAGGAAKWASLVTMALTMLGQSPGLLAGVLRRINFESGGNPNAINLTDSNAMMGTPSQGLMQTIPGTFNAYAGAFRGRGITDPFANIYAGLAYAISRYGSVSAVDPLVRPFGYDRGGMLPVGLSTVYNGTGRPETVTPAGAGGGEPVVVNLIVNGQKLATAVLPSLQRLKGSGVNVNLG